MSEPLPSTSTPPVETVVYRPISGWAVAGFLIGCVFTLLVAVGAVIGIYQGAPLFYPLWFLGTAFGLGLGLSLLGQRHVQNSEGTRAGAGLARIGVWITLVSGLVYFSYFFVTGMAVHGQANAFLMEEGEDSGFFPRLKKGGTDLTQLNTAFLLTQTQRSGRPDNERSMRDMHDIPGEGTSGPLSSFREGMLARLFYKHLGEDAEIIPLGVQDWRYEQRSHKVQRAYRIKTKEVDMEIVLPVLSMEAEAGGQGRKWLVNMKEMRLVSKNFTPLGLGVTALRESAGEWLTRKAQAINEGEKFPAIEQIDKTPWELLPVKDDARATVYSAFTGTGKRLSQFMIPTRPDDAGKWEQVDGNMRIYLNFRFQVATVPGQPSQYQVEGTAGIQTRQAVDPAKFERSSPQPDWDLVSVVFSTVTAPSKGPGGS